MTETKLKHDKQTWKNWRTKLNDLKLDRKRSKKYRLDCKQKWDVLDKIMRKKVTGKGTPEPSHPRKLTALS